VALSIVAVLLLTSVCADLLASDRPLLMRRAGRLYVLPGLTDPLELRGQDHRTLRASLAPERGEWMVETPVPFGPYRSDVELTRVPAPPGGRHWAGTDETGRDVLSRLIHGTRVSLAVGFGAVALYVLLGTLLGAVAGWWGGLADLVVSRAVEVMLSFPALFLVLCILAMIDRPRLIHIVLVIGLTRWPDVARLIRGEVLRIRGLEYVEAARALGASELRILWRHVLPNALGPAVVAATLGVASAILIESSLSFLGFGTPPPTASWGEILTEAQRYASSGAWWLALWPGLALFVTVAAYNLLGEGLRDALDPRLRR